MTDQETPSVQLPVPGPIVEPAGQEETPPLEMIRDLWGAPFQPANCPRCRQTFLVSAIMPDRTCPHCAQGPLQSQPDLPRLEPAEMVVQFAVPPSGLEGRLGEFVRAVWLRPDDFSLERLRSRILPVFWPVWLVDGSVTGSWQAEVGFDYQVKSSQEKYVAGEWRSQEVEETRIRWEPRLGSILRSYSNVATPALTDHQKRISALGRFDYSAAIPWDSQLTDRVAIHIPDLQPESAWPLAQAGFEKAAEEDCRKAAVGQHIRSFKLDPQYDNLHWTLLLLPAYSTYYTDEEGQVHSILIHGQTGQVSGIRIASQRKGWMYGGALAVAALVMLLLGLLSFSLAPVFDPAKVLAPVLALLAFLLAAAALVPIFWPWQWNRGQRAQKTAAQ